MSFRLIVRLPGRHGLAGSGECEFASEALGFYRQLGRSRLRVEQILHLRQGRETPITAPELEAIAQRETPRPSQGAVS